MSATNCTAGFARLDITPPLGVQLAGYFATAEAYDQGGYEPANSWLVKGVAETLQETATEILRSL